MIKTTKLNAIALAAAIALSACGGGSDGNKNDAQPEQPPPPPAGPVSKLPKDSYIMTAVDGDTFSLVIDRQSQFAHIIPLNTMYGVEDTSRIAVKVIDTDLGITIYSSVNQDTSEGKPAFEIYTSPDGNEIVGQVAIAGLNSNVIGTNLEIVRAFGLPIQGAYNGVSMEADSPTAPKRLIDFGIRNVNDSMTFCEDGFYVNNTCTGNEYPAQFNETFGGMARLQVALNGRYRDYAYLLLAQNGNDYSLILDRIQNANGRLVYGTGYAVQATEFKLSNTVKSYACIKQDASGGSYLSLRDDRTYTQDLYDSKLTPMGGTKGTLALNQAVSRSNVVNAQGLVSFVEGSEGLPVNPTTKFSRGLNFSTNMLVLADEKNQQLSVCRSDSLVVKK
ncbi:hypothetical protein [Comamonas thiooxydans]|uniref:hypothetical protein n=1 Tax=Comamonas thiooxydans TaxID=363952 RepID=UPI00050DAB84|nr:hypothetical protein [Comamonas thiooxydans]KGH23581.1 hypothetical protein P606_11735 [Comamonas thiooxydans]